MEWCPSLPSSAANHGWPEDHNPQTLLNTIVFQVGLFLGAGMNIDVQDIFSRRSSLWASRRPCILGVLRGYLQIKPWRLSSRVVYTTICRYSNISYHIGRTDTDTQLVVSTCIRMRIMCLTRSTWKVWNGEARSAVETSSAVLRLSRSRISERSKSLQCWCASRFLSPLSCRLSSFCWAVS